MNFLEKHLEDPVRFARIKRYFYIILGVIALAEVLLLVAQITLPQFFHQEHHGFWFESIPAWGSLYGLISCVLIIVVSKFLGKAWLMRREDHYDS